MECKLLFSLCASVLSVADLPFLGLTASRDKINGAMIPDYAR